MKRALLAAALCLLVGAATAQNFAPISASKTRNSGFGETIRISPRQAKIDVRKITIDRGRCIGFSAALMGNEGVLATKLPFELGTNRWVKVEVFGNACPGHEIAVETGTGRWEFRLD